MAEAKDRNNKTTFVAIPKRFEVVKNDQQGIQSYDLDNKYPQRMKLLASSSVTATACLDLFSKFLRGKGFVNLQFAKSELNALGETANDILADLSKDYSDYGGVCLHFDYNGMLEIVNVRVIPFDYTRLTTPDSKQSGKIAVYQDWEMSQSMKIDSKNILYVDRFTTNKETILKQIEQAGGLEQWNGHVLWWSNRGKKYPMPVYDPAINDIETDAEISQFKKANVTTNFLASHFFLYKGEFEDDMERQQYIDMLRNFQGGKEAGKFMLVDGVTEENKPELIKVDVANNDRLYEYHETSSQNNIRKSFLAPKELVGEEYSTGFETDRITQARSYYNDVTEFNRDDIMGLFAKFVPLFHVSVNPSNDYTIQKLYSV